MSFDPQPLLSSAQLNLSPLRAGDFNDLAAAASDPLIWAGHPAKNRHEPDVFRTYFNMLLDTGQTLVVRDPVGKVIGCSRFYPPTDRPDEMGIGFTFLTRAHWGGTTNRELKRLMVGHVLAHFNSVWFHIDPDNIRSQVATKRLGAEHRYDRELTLGPEPARWKCYELTRDAWFTTASGH